MAAPVHLLLHVVSEGLVVSDPLAEGEAIADDDHAQALVVLEHTPGPRH